MFPYEGFSGSGAQRVLLTGADFYETDAERAAMLASGKVPVGIGKNSYIE